jgi:hypothetical protein
MFNVFWGCIVLAAVLSLIVGAIAAIKEYKDGRIANGKWYNTKSDCYSDSDGKNLYLEIIKDFFFELLTFLIIAVMVWFIGTETTRELGEYKTVVKSYEKQYQVYSIEDNISIKGEYARSFYVGTAYIGNNMEYYSLVEDESGGLIMKKFDAYNTYLVPEENLEEAYYIQKVNTVKYSYYKNPLIGFWFKALKPIVKDEVIRVEIHLPKQYVLKQLKVDLK